MATKYDIEILISPEGQVKLETKGFKGTGCLLEIQRVASQVGEVRSQNFTSEYYEKPISQKIEKRQSA